VRGCFPRPRSATATAPPRPARRVRPHPDGIPQPELSTGYPHPEVELRLVRDGKEVQDEGVLEMKCGALMTHYHKLPEVTAKAMTPDGYYRTGDVFRRDENGFFFFVGRADDMFVCGGENIYPGEVEKMLERHPGIHQAAVIPIPDELKVTSPLPSSCVPTVPTSTSSQ
jgi:acyl-CoA synthetase (AMP-forming)/AMP-acid ligase II